jgi:hydroxymethylpyrimidine pyrophosphatase-like HAD family hydrolase
MGNEQPTIAVDFDGVIADYGGWQGGTTFGLPRTDVIETLEVLRSEGWKIIVHSTRASEDIRPYLIENKIPFDEINCNSSYKTGGVKPVATVYWDDRACRYSGDARQDIETIRKFRTWSGRR